LTRVFGAAIRTAATLREAVGATEHSGAQSRESRVMRNFAVMAVVVFASTGAALGQDIAAGEQSFKKCLPCHAVGEGAKNKVGPELNGLDGRKAGAVADYNYTEANKNSGITWNETTFKEYIRDPRAKIPGTKMVFAGIRNEQEATALWAYLKQFDANGGHK
jgi:cytochrome c